jgi:diguanylate cyclase (GGDEF)-like protein
MKYLDEISESTSAPLELEKMLNHTVGILKKKLKHKTVFIYLLQQNYDSSNDNIKKRLKCIATPDAISLKGFDSFSINLENELAVLLKSMNEKKPTTVNLPDSFSEILEQVKFGAIPITVKGSPKGVILTRPKIPSEDISFLMFFANQIGIAFENSRLYDEIKELATIDDLTNIYNYRYFQKRLPEELQLARRYKNYLSFAIADIDDFKHYNDTNGNPAGDTCLYKLAQILNNSTRTGDVVFRYGGEEFSIIYPATDKKGAVIASEKLKKAVGDFSFEYGKDQPKGKITVSIGISTYPNDAHDHEGLIECAEKALHAAKSSGKDKVCLYRPK